MYTERTLDPGLLCLQFHLVVVFHRDMLGSAIEVQKHEVLDLQHVEAEVVVLRPVLHLRVSKTAQQQSRPSAQPKDMQVCTPLHAASYFEKTTLSA